MKELKKDKLKVKIAETREEMGKNKKFLIKFQLETLLQYKKLKHKK